MSLSIPFSKKSVISALYSAYPRLGVAYSHERYAIDFSGKMTETNKNYDGCKLEIADGLRMSASSEELILRFCYIKDGMDPRNKEATVFDGLYGDSRHGGRQWTETFLRVPEGKINPNEPDYTDGQGRNFYVREFGHGNKVFGLCDIPESGVVPKTKDFFDVWDPITGLPRLTSESANDTKYENHTAHFSFNPNPDRNELGYRDVVVNFLGVMNSDQYPNNRRCVNVEANCLRWGGGQGSYRLVEGPLPEIKEKKLVCL